MLTRINTDLQSFQSLGGIGAFNGIKTDDFMGQMGSAPHIEYLYECQEFGCGWIGPHSDFEECFGSTCNRCCNTEEVQARFQQEHDMDEAMQANYQEELAGGTHWSQQEDCNWQAEAIDDYHRAQFNDEEWAELTGKKQEAPTVVEVCTGNEYTCSCNSCCIPF